MYRTFENEQLYEAPELNQLPFLTKALERGAAERAAKTKAEADKKKQELDDIEKIKAPAGAPKEQNIVIDETKNLVQQSLAHHKAGEYDTKRPERAGAMAEIEKKANTSKQQFESYKSINETVIPKFHEQYGDEYNSGEAATINNTEYNSTPAFGYNPEAALSKVDPDKNLNLYDDRRAMDNFVKTYRSEFQQKYETSGENEKGDVTTKYGVSKEGLFMKPAKDASGRDILVPGVSDNVVNRMLADKPLLNKKVMANVIAENTNDAKRVQQNAELASANNPKWGKYKGKSIEEITHLLNEEGNPLRDNKTVGQRTFDVVKSELENRNRQSMSYTSARTTDEQTGDGDDKKKKINRTDAYFTGETETTNDKKIQSGAPGYSILQNGKPVVLTTTSPTTFGVNDGLRRDGQRVSRTFQTNEVQLRLFTKSGNLASVEGNNVDEQIKNLNSKSDEFILQLTPPRIALRGIITDKTKILGDVAELAKQKKITQSEADQITNEAKSAGDMDDFLEIMMANKVTAKLIDEIIPADGGVLGQLKAMGEDFTTKENWSPEMKQLDHAFQARYQEALLRKQKKTQKTTATQNKPNGSEKKQKNAPKIVKRSVISGLVGKPGYEGYTEKELIAHYKSIGYTIN